MISFFFFQAEDGIRDHCVTGVQTCALPISGQASWWAPTVWRLSAILLWAWKLRKLNGPNFTYPMLLFASAMPEWLMEKMGKIYIGKPIKVKTRTELLMTIKPSMRQYVRTDTGDIPEDFS